MLEFHARCGLAKAIRTMPSPERPLPDWLNDPDCQALCEDIANLCWELARKQAAIEVTRVGTLPCATPLSELTLT
jgi:hypothetical protein